MEENHDFLFKRCRPARETQRFGDDPVLRYARLCSIRLRRDASATHRIPQFLFSVVVDTLKENHGTAAKFVGDAVFAYWLSEEQPNHAALACRFAASLPERLSVVSSGVTTSIGIHTGNVAFVRFTSGNNRSPEPMGDAVNLASRLCGFCFHYKAKAVASEAVMTSAGGGQGWTLLDSATIKGRNEPVTLYGIL